MKQQTKLFTIDYIMVSVASVLLRLAMQYKITLIPIYFLELRMTKIQAGFSMTVFTISALLLRPLCGKLVDDIGRKMMLFIGIVIFSASTLPFGFFDNLYLLYFLQILSGIGFSILSVALTTMITDVVPEDRLTEGIGYFGLTTTLSQAVGPLLAVWSLGVSGYPALFFSCGLTMALAVVSIKFISYEIETKEPIQPTQNKWIDKLVERNALLPSAFMGGLSFISAATIIFLVPYAQSEGINNIGLYFTARAGGIILSRLFIGKLINIINRKTAIGFGIAGIIIGVGGISVFQSLFTLILIAVIYGVGHGIANVLFNVAAVKNTHPERRAYANATFYLAMDVGIGVGSLLWGVVGDFCGMNNIFLIAAAFASGILVCFRFSKIK